MSQSVFTDQQPVNTLPSKASSNKSLPNKSLFVQALFNRIAPTYDLLNDVISLGQHRLWKQAACQALQLQPGNHVLDVCTGTGDLAALLSNQVGSGGQVTGLDFSEAMLAVARERFSARQNLQFIQGDAMALPFEDNRFHGAIVSFGLRNVSDIKQVLAEMARVTQPGGWIVNLDTAPKANLPGFGLYFKHLMPRLGGLFANDREAYGYLAKSTQGFLAPEALIEVFKQVGLANIGQRRFGFGSVAMQAGQKGV